MKLKELFGKNPVNQEVENECLTNEISVESDTSMMEKTNSDMITIKYGTEMPIDVIFNFIRRDFESDGYADALVSSDPTYKATKEGMIRNELKMLFTQVGLKYKNDISMIDVEIENYRQACLMTCVSSMQSRRSTFQEHLDKLHEMEEQLDNNDPRMMIMIESYRRGFLKGMAAKMNNVIND